jgi:hypothetical protein
MHFSLFLATAHVATVQAAAIASQAAQYWQPPANTGEWQIILSNNLNTNGGLTPSSATVWDLDLFNTDASTISTLKAQGLKVICYFSAGESSVTELIFLLML